MNSRRYSEAQKQAAMIYFISRGGVILEEGEKKSGNYVYQVQVDGSNKRFKIENNRLWWWERWDWRPIFEAKLPRLHENANRMDELRKSFLAEMEKTT